MVNVIVAVLSLLAIVVIVGAVLGWLRSGASEVKKSQLPAEPNADTIGRTTGMLGGDIADAAFVQYVLQRNEETTGKPSTQSDAVLVAAIQQGIRSQKK